MFEQSGINRQGWGRETIGRRGSRRFRPAIDSSERLEARALLHAGPVVGHAPAIVRGVDYTPSIPTAAIQAALAASYAGGSTAGQTVQTPDGAIFLPSGLVPGQAYPLAVAFAYNGNPGIPFQVWQIQAQQNHWIVYASRSYTNPVLRSGLASSDKVAERVKAQVDALAGVLPIDRSRIFFTGLSGAANYADFMNLRYPGYAAGVIINSGQIPAQLFSRTPRPGYLTMPSASDFGGSRRLAVFLCSPADPQFYGITQANARTMQRLGWDVLFLSFPGGHRNAPAATYNKAMLWIMSQPSWTTNP